MNKYVKYPRTPHSIWSREKTEDDKVLTSMDHFEGEEVVASEKLDGECTTIYPAHIHARSVESKDHPSRAWVKAFAGSMQHQIPKGWRVCGENLYAKHSIMYHDLDTYFYGFSIWNDQNVALSWDDTLEWFTLLGITPVPTLYRGIYNESIIKGLYDPNDLSVEGWVMRTVGPIPYAEFGKKVAKLVRKNHVQTSQHWMQEKVIPNKLKDL